MTRAFDGILHMLHVIAALIHIRDAFDMLGEPILNDDLHRCVDMTREVHTKRG